LTAGDFNRDGKIDIAIDYSLNSQQFFIPGFGPPATEGGAVVYTLNSPYDPEKASWPMYYHDPQNSCVYGQANGSTVRPPLVIQNLPKTLNVPAGTNKSVPLSFDTTNASTCTLNGNSIDATASQSHSTSITYSLANGESSTSSVSCADFYTQT